MKILIIGCGLLGMKLYENLHKEKYDVYGTFYEHPIENDHCFRLDITKIRDVNHLINKISPDIIVHTSAVTNVDECERDRKKASSVNVQGTRNVVYAGEKIGATVVYISTDYVFDGEQGLYKEEERVNPINYYGSTKLEGEKVVAGLCHHFIIARTSVLYGDRKNNFATWLVEKLQKEEDLTVVDDQFVSPTLNDDLAEQLIALFEADESGVFHTAGGERISRYAFACMVADVFDLDKSLIVSGHINDMKWAARRPKDSSLDISKISKIKKPYTVQQAVHLLKDEMSDRISKDTLE